MTTSLPLYLAYAPSGVPWLGDMPAHWEVRRLKWLAATNPSKSEIVGLLDRDTTVVFLPMERISVDGKVDFRESRPLSEVQNGFTYFRRGDVVLAKITPCFENGKGAHLHELPTEVGFGTTEFIVLRAGPDVMAEYLYVITVLQVFRKLGADAMRGAAGQQRVPVDFVRNFAVPLPPVPEQQAIVRYLDHHDRLIRRYIRARQRLVALLTEQKQAIIQRAVTRGLDPTAPLKPSGVEWLGDVPAHWEVRRLKSLLVLNDSGTWGKDTVDDGTLVLRSTEQTIDGGWRIEAPARRALTPKEEARSRLQPDDLVITKSSGSAKHIGKTSIVTADIAALGYCFSNFMQRIRLRNGFAPLLAWYWLNNPISRSQLVNSSTTTTGLANLNGTIIGNLWLVVPPQEEQLTILLYLRGAVVGFDRAIAAARRQIELMREYRTRLIADVVTGKVDVRGVALPEDEEDATDDAALVADVDLDDAADGGDDGEDVGPGADAEE